MTSKRGFRKAPAASPEYPTHDSFEPSRRTFLTRLGALAGAAALARLLPACGDRAVGDDQPDMKTLGGKPDMMPAPVDAGPETTLGGVPDMMAAPADAGPDHDHPPGTMPRIPAPIDGGPPEADGE